MWIRQPGNAYGPGGKGRVGKNGGARGGFQVYRPPVGGGFRVVHPPQSGFIEVHPVPPKFQNTRALPSQGKLHDLVKNVNLAAAMDRFKRMAGIQPARTLGHSVTPAAPSGRQQVPFFGGAPQGRPSVPFLAPRGGGGPATHPGGLAMPRGIGGFINQEQAAGALEAQLAAGFAANPNLGPTSGAPIPSLEEMGLLPRTPEAQAVPDMSSIDVFMQQQLEAQRQAMLARLMRQHPME